MGQYISKQVVKEGSAVVLTVWSAVYKLLSNQMHYSHYIQFSGSLIRSEEEKAGLIL